MRMKFGAAALATVSLGGCASSLNGIADPFVQPAKYQFLRCEDIAKRLVTTKAREQELRGLMDRASTDTGGSAVNFLVYQPDYLQVQSDLRRLNEAAAEKQCPDETPKAGETPKAEQAGKAPSKGDIGKPH
jgi:hypothetical protein